MCLVNFQLHDHPHYKLIIAANRDEFYARPTALASFWDDYPEILAGRDLLQMGTWLGITKNGRFAALTNYRNPDLEDSVGKHSRGEIITNYLKSDTTPEAFLENLHNKRDNYVGFNVIIGNPDTLYYYNNIQGEISLIESGTHSLSNHFLNTPWPKVVKGRNQLKSYLKANEEIEIDKLFEIVSDAEEASDDVLPQTGVGIELERRLSPLFIRTPDYGTRSQTVLLVDNSNKVSYIERTYNKGIFQKDNSYSFQIVNG